MNALLLITRSRLDRTMFEWSLLIDDNRGCTGAIVSGPKRYPTKRLAKRHAMEWARRLNITIEG